MKIELVESVEPLFKELVDDAFKRQRRPVSPPVEFYVVGLLEEMVTAKLEEQALCLRLFGPAEPRVIVLKELGDEALFVSGFFGERVRRMGLSSSYYASVGSSAYGELSGKMRPPVSEVYSEMSRKFDLLQKALRDVRSSCDAMGMDWRLAAEEWLRTRSPASERRLAALGLVLSLTGEC